MGSERRYRQRLSKLAESWRAVALRGLVAVLFGLVVLLWPGLILGVLALLFGIYALVDGATVVVPALRAPDRGARRWLPLSEGAAGVVTGLVAVLWPGLTVSGLLYVIAAWGLLTGSGALSVLFAVILAAVVGSGLPSVAPLIGAFAVAVGLALIVFALRM